MKIKKITTVFLLMLLPLTVLITVQCRHEASEPRDVANTSRGVTDESAEEKTYSEVTLEDRFADDRVVIVLNKATSMNFKTYTPKDFPEVPCTQVTDSTMLTMEVVRQQLEAERTGDWSKLKERIETGMLVDIDKFRRILDIHLPVKSKENVLKAIKLLEKREDILYAGPDYFMELCALPDPLPAYIGNQMDALNSISLPEAWDIITGSGSYCYIGVLDSGIQANHPALTGLVDQDMSRDFTTNTTHGNVYPYGLEDPDGHGTHVSGIITTNGVGTIGACWNLMLVSLRVFDRNGSLNNNASRIRYAVDFATSYGISILNYSGRILSSYTGFNDVSASIRQYPGLFVCAAGNNGDNNNTTPYYPANFQLPNLIAVGSIDSNGSRSSFSNYGSTTVDLFAPGGSIYSTVPGSYDYKSGTSMAAPYVTGVAALIKVLHPGYFYSTKTNSPGISAPEIKQIINESVQPDANLLCKSGGRLNAYNAVRNLRSNGTSINGRTILGSTNIDFQGVGTIGKFYLFPNRTWVIAPRGVSSSPVSYSPSTHPNYISWGALPSPINKTTSDYFTLWVPTSSSSGPYYYTHKFYLKLSSSGVQFSSAYSYWEEPSLSPGEKRLIYVSGSGTW